MMAFIRNVYPGILKAFILARTDPYVYPVFPYMGLAAGHAISGPIIGHPVCEGATGPLSQAGGVVLNSRIRDVIPATQASRRGIARPVVLSKPSAIRSGVPDGAHGE
jgi:hypothetical protein